MNVRGLLFYGLPARVVVFLSYTSSTSRHLLSFVDFEMFGLKVFSVIVDECIIT